MNTDHLTLNDGTKLPLIGFGTYTLKGQDGARTILEAIQNGYRLIDSAFNYENEGTVGDAVKRCGLPRGELFITSKLPGRRHKYHEALQTIEESLYRMGLDYIDLYLIHWPNPWQELYVEAWQALIEAQKRGYLRSIGVCNFLPEHLEKLIEETGVTPSVNQIELHPYFNQETQRNWDRDHGIIDEAWSPIGRGSQLLHDPVLQAIAAAYGKSVHQIILRWHVQLGVIPLPKAASPEHQKANLEALNFSLIDQDMARINELSRKDGRLYNQNPAVYEEF